MRNQHTSIHAISLLVGLSITLTFGYPQPTPEANPAAIKDFVRQVYIEGVPYEDVGRLSADVAIPVLREMLNNPQEEEYWPNVVVTLGMLGDDRAVEPLVNFIERKEPGKQLSRAQSVAKTSAVMALGYVVNRTGNQRALKYLEEGIYPSAWEKRNLPWASSFFPSGAERNNQLVIMSVLGLGLSGRAEATKVLRLLRDPHATPEIVALKQQVPGIDNIADEALKASESIGKDGMRMYYKKELQRQPPDH